MPANQMDQADIISAINALVGTDKAKVKEFAKALRAESRDVAQALINVGAGQKAGEMTGKVGELEEKVKELEGQLEAKDTEITDLRSKTPDAAQLEETAKKRWEPKVKAATERAEQAETRAREAIRRSARQKFVAALTAPDEQGMYVEPQWAEKVVAAEYDDRLIAKPDFSLGVLQPGENTEYDGDTDEARIAALARDARRTVPSTYVLSRADAGAGIRGGGGNASVGLKTPDQIRQQKQQNPAFAGL